MTDKHIQELTPEQKKQLDAEFQAMLITGLPLKELIVVPVEKLKP